MSDSEQAEMQAGKKCGLVFSFVFYYLFSCIDICE